MRLFSWSTLENLLKGKCPPLFLPPKRKRKAARKAPPLSKLYHQGNLYNLQEIYSSHNALYFDGKLDLKITWFGSAARLARRHRKLGLYCFQDKLIKIHRLLDQPHFPPYFISYVVYHEMLHCVCPPVKARRGRYSIHHPEFKMKEKEFADYAAAKRWEEENKKLFFRTT